MRFQFLGQEDPLEEGMVTHSSILAWKSHGQKSLRATIHGVAETAFLSIAFLWD